MQIDFSNAERAEVLHQALPYIKRYVGRIVVIKYGGNAMINEALKEQVMGDMVLLHLIGVKGAGHENGGIVVYLSMSETIEKIVKKVVPVMRKVGKTVLNVVGEVLKRRADGNKEENV